MSEILQQENAIILAASQKMVLLGSQASQKAVDGKESKEEDKDGELILLLLTAYRRKAAMTDAQLESILYDLRRLSGEDEFPSVNPIVGQEIVYYFESTEGAWIVKGDWDGSTNAFPTGTIKKGYQYFNTANTTSLLGPDGGIIPAGTIIVAKIDSPGQSIANWYFLVTIY